MTECETCSKYGNLVEPIEPKFRAWRQMNFCWFVSEFIIAIDAFLQFWQHDSRWWQSHFRFKQFWGFLYRHIVKVEIIEPLPIPHPNCRSIFIDLEGWDYD